MKPEAGEKVERPHRWDVEVCDHCGYGRHENWRCEHGMCSDGLDGGRAEPSFSMVEAMPVSEHEALRTKVEEEIKRHRKIAEDHRWHPFIRQQRGICADRLQALLDNQEGEQD